MVTPNKFPLKYGVPIHGSLSFCLSFLLPVQLWEKLQNSLWFSYSTLFTGLKETILVSLLPNNSRHNRQRGRQGASWSGKKLVIPVHSLPQHDLKLFASRIPQDKPTSPEQG